MDNVAITAVPAYLASKAAWSWANDAYLWWAPRRPVPQFSHPKLAWEYLASRYTYTGDPFSGAGDFYLSPYRLQAALEQGGDAPRRLSVDCDDVAGWAAVACRQIPGCSVQVKTLYDESGRFGHHVVCHGTMHGRPFVIDTNGYRDLPDVTDATLCRVLSEIYKIEGYRYVAAFVGPYPW